MKLKNIFFGLTAAVATMCLSSCDEERDPIIIEGDLPIKTSVLYMVGDATPNGWSIDNPTPLEASADDPLVFSWEGSLYTGEIKLCLTTGSWDAPFIRPENNGTSISKTNITDQKFIMHAGDPDNKWRVTEAGKYRLTFDLRNWTMSTEYLGENDAPVIDPIVADAVYMLGDATPNGWDNNNPTELVKKSQYIFEYEGELHAGEMKACLEKGSWDVPFIRPTAADCKINKSGVESADFVFTTGPDNKWRVEEAGIYRLTFDLEHWIIEAVFVAEVESSTDPIETETLFMIGDATPGGWSMDDASQFTRASNKYVFNWEGELVPGEMKACLVQDGTFSCPFLHPSTADVSISSAGVAASDFLFYAGDPDNKWRVTEAGKYRITFDLEHWTIKAVMLSSSGSTKEPIETETLYMIGDATPNSWSMDNPTEFTRSGSDKYVFTWEGELKTGEMKACLVKDGTFSCPFLHPSTADVTISSAGVAASDFLFYAGEPDNKWKVTEAGTYRITFNLKDYTIAVEKK
ncbi:MAG: SusF/SusE family outer membrane protein [Candidatus Limisoma sp.]